jgi:hypothetical protein
MKCAEEKQQMCYDKCTYHFILTEQMFFLPGTVGIVANHDIFTLLNVCFLLRISLEEMSCMCKAFINFIS